jgi:hypothetical protein
MLRASSLAFDYPLDVDAVRDPQIPSGVPGGNLLLRLVDAVLDDTEPLADIQNEIIEGLGPESLVDAASVLGNFEMMNRVAEATGITVPGAALERERELIGSLAIESFVKH